MYLIKAGSLTIYDSRDKVTYPVIKPVLTRELNSAGTLTFTVIPGHPHYDKLKKMQTFITVYRDNTELFYGRVLSTDKGLDGRLEVSCEGGLTFFLDTEMEKSENTETITSFINRCVNIHNGQVEAAKKFTVGTIQEPALFKDKTYPFDVTNYSVTKSILESLLINRFGGFLRVRPGSNGIHYLDYVENYGRNNTQPIKIGNNIEDKNDRVSGENIFTILRPIGRTSGQENEINIESLSQSDITLSNVTKDGKLLRLTDKIAEYGSIVHTEEFGDAETPQALLSKAEEYIKRHGTQLRSSVDITFVDFYHLNKNVMAVELGDMFSNIEGFSGQTLTVGEITNDLENPANDTITLKNAEELNANRSDSFSSSRGGSSGSSMSSSVAKNKSQEAFRYKYIHENQDQLILATKEIEIHASEKFRALSNKIFLTAEDKPGKPGELVFKAIRHADDKHGAEIVVTVDNISLHKSDGDLAIDGYATDAELKVEKDRITAEVSRATEAEGKLSSQLQVTADGVTAATGRLTKVEGSLSTIEGSTLWLRRDNITGVTGKMEVDKNGNLIVKDGAGFRARYGSAEYGIFNENNLTAGVLVERINGGTTKILGNNVSIEANESFKSVLADTTRTSKWVKEYEGTGIYQNRDNITQVAGRFRVDQNGNVHVVNGSGLYLGEGSASLAVYKSGDINAGFIASQINGGTATIQGNHINMEANSSFNLKVGKGAVATQLSVECGNVSISGGNLIVSGYITSNGLITTMGNFKSAITTSGSISGASITADRFYIGRGESSQVVQKVLKMGTASITNSAMLGLGTAGDTDLSHYHAITAEAGSDGKVTIKLGAAQSTEGSANFNIADTKFYKDGVSAAWTKAYKTVRINNDYSPGSGSKSIVISSGESVQVYAQAKQNANASVWTNVETVTVTAVGSSGPTVTGYYPSSFEVTNVVKTSRGYTVYADIKVTVTFSDGTSMTSSAYPRSGSYYD